MGRTALRIIVFSVVFALLAMLGAAVEPMGIDNALEGHSREQLYRILAPGYGTPTDESRIGEDAEPWRPSTTDAAREKIVTVYLSEQVIRTMRTIEQGAGWLGWRPGYAEHARILFRLASMSGAEGEPLTPPPAIFVDFTFLETGATAEEQANFQFFLDTVSFITRREDWPADRSCVTPLEELACIKDAGGVPVIFAKSNLYQAPPGAPDSAAQNDTAPAQAALDAVTILAPVSYSGFGGEYPLFVTQPLADGSVREEPTPATLMFLSWCIDNENACPFLESAQAPGETRAQRFVNAFTERRLGDLSLIWGSATPDHYADIDRAVTGESPMFLRAGWFAAAPEEGTPEANACRIESRTSSWAGILLQLFWSRIPGHSYDDIRQRCLYHAQVPYHALETGIAEAGMADALFDGRVIVLGARFVNGGDWSPSVVHGLLPGMHVHAMALDNLMTWQERFIRAPHPFIMSIGGFAFGRWDDIDIIEGGALFLMALATGLGQLWLNRRKARMARQGRMRSHWAVYGVMLGAIVGIVGFSIWLFLAVFRVAPPNWLGLVLIGLGLSFVVIRQELGTDIVRMTSRHRRVTEWGAKLADLSRKAGTYLNIETVGREAPHLAAEPDIPAPPPDAPEAPSANSAT